MVAAAIALVSIPFVTSRARRVIPALRQPDTGSAYTLYILSFSTLSAVIGSSWGKRLSFQLKRVLRPKYDIRDL